MIIEVTKTVRIEITPEEIAERRKRGGAFINEGVLTDDMNLTYIVANNKAIDRIMKQDKSSVTTTTSIDSQVDFHI